HNHELLADNAKFTMKFRKFDQAVLAEIEHAVVYEQYVVPYDNTSRTNKYNYPLSLFIIINNDRKSHLGAQVFLNDETQESYEWVLQQILDATSYELTVILTNMDPAMQALKAKLGAANFKQFVGDFWKMHNSLSVNVFKQQRIFIASMQSTQCVESINTIIHKAVSSSSTISDVVEALDFQMQKEAIDKDFLA
ncbi:44451_t:CDS:2, partial [Gigaspora margarita]